MYEELAEEYTRRILNLLGKIEDEKLKEGCILFFSYYQDRFRKWPASIGHHGNQECGLIRHTAEVMKMALDISSCVTYPVNQDYLIASAFLHDFGKLDDYERNPEFPLTEWRYVTPRGPDHSLFPIINYPIVTGKALPKEVCNAILCHMGGWSKTSVFPETYLEGILCAADLISTRTGSKME
jgi:hypothetical protein